MPTFRNILFHLHRRIAILHTYPPMKMEQSVSKRLHIKFRRGGITQKKAYNWKYPRTAEQLRKTGSTALISYQRLDLNWGCMFEYSLSVRFAAALYVWIHIRVQNVGHLSVKWHRVCVLIMFSAFLETIGFFYLFIVTSLVISVLWRNREEYRPMTLNSTVKSSFLNRCTRQSPAERDDTRGCTYTITT